MLWNHKFTVTPSLLPFGGGRGGGGRHVMVPLWGRTLRDRRNIAWQPKKAVRKTPLRHLWYLSKEHRQRRKKGVKNVPLFIFRSLFLQNKMCPKGVFLHAESTGSIQMWNYQAFNILSTADRRLQWSQAATNFICQNEEHNSYIFREMFFTQRSFSFERSAGHRE